MHPNRKQFTYQEQSRLDQFLVTSISSNYIQSSSIFHSGIKSDHKCVKITMNLKESKRGPGVSKMNISILQDIAYIENIGELISEVKESYHVLSKQMLWEILKIKIKEYTIG